MKWSFSYNYKNRREPAREVPEHYAGRPREFAQLLINMAHDHERATGRYPIKIILPSNVTSGEVMIAEELGFELT